ncbi:MAG: tyrosine-type recombinase/integrase [Bryobacteraceae bacterium]
MAVYKQPKSRNWWYKFTWNGESIRKSTKQSNKRIAEQMEAAHKTALAKGEVGIREKLPAPTLAAFGSRFMEAIETQCGDKPATVSFYRNKLDCLLKSQDLSRLPLDRIDEVTIDAYKQARSRQKSRRKRPLAVASLNRELATLKRLLRLAYKWKIIDRVPLIQLFRGEHNREFIVSYEQERLYLDTAAGDLKDLALLLLDTGLRVGEALRLEWPEVHLTPANGASYGYLTVRAAIAKNSKSRNVPLSARVLAMFNGRNPARSGYVFQRLDGRKLSQTSLNEQHRDLRALLKMPEDFVPHSFRHTFGTRLGESGTDLFTIMRLMGHSSVTISQRYVHPSPESVERAFARMEALSDSERQKVGIPVGIPEGAGSVAVQ